MVGGNSKGREGATVRGWKGQWGRRLFQCNTEGERRDTLRECVRSCEAKEGDDRAVQQQGKR
jgi:hypothetical protein